MKKNEEKRAAYYQTRHTNHLYMRNEYGKHQPSVNGRLSENRRKKAFNNSNKWDILRRKPYFLCSFLLLFQ